MQSQQVLTYDDDFLSNIDDDIISESIDSEKDYIDKIETDKAYDTLFTIYFSSKSNDTANNIERRIRHRFEYLTISTEIVCLNIFTDDSAFLNSVESYYTVEIHLKHGEVKTANDVIMILRSLTPLYKYYYLKSINYTSASNDRIRHSISYPELAAKVFSKEYPNGENKGEYKVGNVEYDRTEVIYTITDVFELCKYLIPDDNAKNRNIIKVFNSLIISYDLFSKSYGYLVYDSYMDMVMNKHLDEAYELMKIKSMIGVKDYTLIFKKSSEYNRGKCKITHSFIVHDKPSYAAFRDVLDEYHNKLDITIGVNSIYNTADIIKGNRPEGNFSIWYSKGSIEKNTYTKRVVHNIYDNFHPLQIKAQLCSTQPEYPDYVMSFICNLEEMLSKKHMQMKALVNEYNTLNNENVMSVILNVGYQVCYNDYLYIGTYGFSGDKHIVCECLSKLNIPIV